MAIDRMKDINVFVHVAEAKSFTAASERIRLSRSAVGKSIVRIEDRLGVRLLQRTTRSVSLTGEGAAFHERCVRLLADLDEAEMAIAEPFAGAARALRDATLGRYGIARLATFLISDDLRAGPVEAGARTCRCQRAADPRGLSVKPASVESALLLRRTSRGMAAGAALGQSLTEKTR